MRKIGDTEHNALTRLIETPAYTVAGLKLKASVLDECNGRFDEWEMLRLFRADIERLKTASR